MVPKINKKSIKSKPGPHRVLPCALQCPRIVPGSSQDAKVEAPSMPNDTHGHHKPEIWSQKYQEIPQPEASEPDSKSQQASKPIRILPSHDIQKPTSQQTLQQRVLAKQKTDSKTQQASKPIRILASHQASNHEACDCQRGRRQG